jgi:hypothetical protein
MSVAVRSVAMLATLLAGSIAFAQPGVTPPGGSAAPPSAAPQPQPQIPPDYQPPPPPGAVPAATVLPPGTTIYLVPAPPQNEDWNHVSHINGAPVKVGERGDYLVRWKTTNIASNPIGWMFGFFGLSVSEAIHEHVALRGDVNWFDFIHSSTTGYEVSANAVIYFRRVFSGPFLEGGIVGRSLRYADQPDSTVVGPEVMFGWHWTYDWGINVAIATGAMRGFNRSTDTVEPVGYFRVGYAF